MAERIKYLKRLERPAVSPEFAGNVEHPFRGLTESLAHKTAETWSPELAKHMERDFDQMAVEWEQKISPGEQDGVVDALERGGVSPDVLCIELGAGTGLGTRALSQYCRKVIATDISLEMLKRFPKGYARVQGDADRLPFGSGCADLVVMVNMFLFPGEVKRILKPGGKVVWFSSLGPNTPIYLSPEKLLDIFPENWSAIAGEIGRASWCVLSSPNA